MGFEIDTTVGENVARIQVEGDVDMFTSSGLRDALMPLFKKKVDGYGMYVPGFLLAGLGAACAMPFP